MIEQRDRPIAEAALAVEETAKHALAMLQELQAGWLWKLLTIPFKQKR